MVSFLRNDQKLKIYLFLKFHDWQHLHQDHIQLSNKQTKKKEEHISKFGLSVVDSLHPPLKKKKVYFGGFFEVFS